MAYVKTAILIVLQCVETRAPCAVYDSLLLKVKGERKVKGYKTVWPQGLFNNSFAAFYCHTFRIEPRFTLFGQQWLVIWRSPMDAIFIQCLSYSSLTHAISEANEVFSSSDVCLFFFCVELSKHSLEEIYAGCSWEGSPLFQVSSICR